MRKKLGLFANVRPTFTFPSLVHKSPLKLDRVDGVDLVFFRELTGGVYFGEPRGRNEQGTKAFDTNVYSKEEIVRLARMGFEAAQKRRKLLTCVDKANVMATSRLWRETVQELAPEYPDVKVEYEFVDAVAMRLIQWPKAYDVLITENLFGDILTDEASVISGSMGLPPVLYRHRIEMTVSGPYIELLRWMRSVEGMPRKLMWQTLQLEVKSPSPPELTFSVHTYSPDRDALEIAP